MKSFQVNVDTELLKEFKSAVALSGKTMAEITRNFMQDFVNTIKNQLPHNLI